MVCASRVYTSFVPLRRARCVLAVDGAVVRAYGERGRAQQDYESLAGLLGGGVSLDYGDSVVVPGFVDCHAHPCSLGLQLMGLDLSHARSLDELLEAVSKAPTIGGWVYGRGWDQEKLGATPTRWDLDRVVPDKPVLLVRVCGHAAAMNTLAMRLLGLLDKPDPRLMELREGTPTGIVYEDLVAKALDMVRRSVPPLQACLRGLRELLRYGVTCVAAMGADAWSLTGMVLARMEGTGVPRCRVYLSRELFDKLYQLGVPLRLGDDRLRITGVKLFADGSLGARTARLSAPYTDKPSERGKLLTTAEELATYVRRAREHGLDVAVHAIGDEAARIVLQAYQVTGFSGRIEHFSLAPPALAVEAARLRVRVAVQPRFLVSDWWAPSRLGGRITSLYPYKTLYQLGVKLGFSSDTPVEPPNPLEGVWAAATRGCLAEWTSHETLGVQLALHLYTAGSAEVLGEERLGRLEPGYMMDLAVLDRDPLEVDVDELPRLRVEGVLVDGKPAKPG